MFPKLLSLKISSSELEALRQADAMIAHCIERTQTPYSRLHHAEIKSGRLDGKPSAGDRRTFRLVGSVTCGRELLPAKVVIKLMCGIDRLWYPCKGNLLLGKVHYSFEVMSDGKLYMRREFEGNFPH